MSAFGKLPTWWRWAFALAVYLEMQDYIDWHNRTARESWVKPLERWRRRLGLDKERP